MNDTVAVPIEVTATEPELPEHVSDAAIDIAQIQADRDIELASVHSEERMARLETEMMECRTALELATTDREMLQSRLTILETSFATMQAASSSSTPEPTVVVADDPVVVQEPEEVAIETVSKHARAEDAPPEPEVRRRKTRLL